MGMLALAIAQGEHGQKLDHAARHVYYLAARYATDKALDPTRPEYDKGPCYFGGWELAAKEALGKIIPDEPSEQDQSDEAKRARTKRENARRAVTNCWAQIVDAGLAELVGKPGLNRRANYRLIGLMKGTDELLELCKKYKLKLDHNDKPQTSFWE